MGAMVTHHCRPPEDFNDRDTWRCRKCGRRFVAWGGEWYETEGPQEGISHADAQFDHEGWQYGVMSHHWTTPLYGLWNGRTQRRRVERYIERRTDQDRAIQLRWGTKAFDYNYEVVRRRRDGEWESCP